MIEEHDERETICDSVVSTIFMYTRTLIDLFGKFVKSEYTFITIL